MIVVAGGVYLSVASVSADTYRWKDKEGKTHYGTSVPAEYADQPYDVLNDAGIVIKRVEDTREPLPVRAEKKIKEKVPLISDEERQRQSDRLLVIQYRSEQDIQDALDMEIAQLGYDYELINQSMISTVNAIRDQIGMAANLQRAGTLISAEQQKQIDKLHRRLIRDEKRIAALDNREAKIRVRFKVALDRYRLVIARDQENDETQADQG